MVIFFVREGFERKNSIRLKPGNSRMAPTKHFPTNNLDVNVVRCVTQKGSLREKQRKTLEFQ